MANDLNPRRANGTQFGANGRGSFSHALSPGPGTRPAPCSPPPPAMDFRSQPPPSFRMEPGTMPMPPAPSLPMQSASHAAGGQYPKAMQPQLSPRAPRPGLSIRPWPFAQPGVSGMKPERPELAAKSEPHQPGAARPAAMQAAMPSDRPMTLKRDAAAVPTQLLPAKREAKAEQQGGAAAVAPATAPPAEPAAASAAPKEEDRGLAALKSAIESASLGSAGEAITSPERTPVPPSPASPASTMASSCGKSPMKSEASALPGSAKKEKEGGLKRTPSSRRLGVSAAAKRMKQAESKDELCGIKSSAQMYGYSQESKLIGVLCSIVPAAVVSCAARCSMLRSTGL